MKIIHTKGRGRVVALALQNIEKKVVAVLLMGVLIFAVLYMYFLGSAVVHAVVRKEVQHNIADAHSRIAELEVSYLERKDDITTSLAHELGFTSIAQKDFVERVRYLGRAQ